MLCQVFEVELLVGIVGIARQHFKADGKIPISRLNQEETFAGVIFGAECVVSVKFPKLIMIIGTSASLWCSY